MCTQKCVCGGGEWQTLFLFLRVSVCVFIYEFHIYSKWGIHFYFKKIQKQWFLIKENQLLNIIWKLLNYYFLSLWLLSLCFCFPVGRSLWMFTSVASETQHPWCGPPVTYGVHHRPSRAHHRPARRNQPQLTAPEFKPDESPINRPCRHLGNSNHLATGA